MTAVRQPLCSSLRNCDALDFRPKTAHLDAEGGDDSGYQGAYSHRDEIFFVPGYRTSKPVVHSPPAGFAVGLWPSEPVALIFQPAKGCDSHMVKLWANAVQVGSKTLKNSLNIWEVPRKLLTVGEMYTWQVVPLCSGGEASESAAFSTKVGTHAPTRAPTVAPLEPLGVDVKASKACGKAIGTIANIDTADGCIPDVLSMEARFFVYHGRGKKCYVYSDNCCGTEAPGSCTAQSSEKVEAKTQRNVYYIPDNVASEYLAQAAG